MAECFLLLAVTSMLVTFLLVYMHVAHKNHVIWTEGLKKQLCGILREDLANQKEDKEYIAGRAAYRFKVYREHRFFLTVW